MKKILLCHAMLCHVHFGVAKLPKSACDAFPAQVRADLQLVEPWNLVEMGNMKPTENSKEKLTNFFVTKLIMY